jgi:type III pantothenate kinase
MKLLVDIGNSRTKYLFEQANQLTVMKSIGNEKIDEQWLVSITVSVEKIILASVGDARINKLFEQHAYQLRVPFLKVISEYKRFGVTSSYQKPATLGVDRWLTLLATNVYCKSKNVLIIDAGTATTADLLCSSGQHLGGWILPGIDTLFKSLLKSTSQVQATQKYSSALMTAQTPTLAFGKSTSAGVNNACWAATLGFIEQAIKQAETQVSVDNILITGGNAEKLSALLSVQHQVVHQLVFLGLQRY